MKSKKKKEDSGFGKMAVVGGIAAVIGLGIGFLGKKLMVTTTALMTLLRDVFLRTRKISKITL